MKSLGFHSYAIGAIQYDQGDIARRQKRQDVVELAASRKKLAINPLLVGPEGVLVAGRDRLAAELLNGSRDVMVHVVAEVTELELLELEVEENVRRRDIDRDQQLARLVDLTEQKIRKRGAAGHGATGDPSTASGGAPKQPAPPPAVTGQGARKGRPVTPEGEARRQVAKAAGASVEAVRRAQRRAADKSTQKEGGGASGTPAAPPPAINTFGVAVDEDLAGRIANVIHCVAEVDKYLRAAQAAVTRAWSYADNKGEALAIGKKLHDLAEKERAGKPVALCPYGKGRCTNDCSFCRGKKWVTAEDMQGTFPAELLREGAAAMVTNGRGGFVPFDKGSPEGAFHVAPPLPPQEPPASRAPSPATGNRGRIARREPGISVERSHAVKRVGSEEQSRGAPESEERAHGGPGDAAMVLDLPDDGEPGPGSRRDGHQGNSLRSLQRRPGTPSPQPGPVPGGGGLPGGSAASAGEVQIPDGQAGHESRREPPPSPSHERPVAPPPKPGKKPRTITAECDTCGAELFDVDGNPRPCGCPPGEVAA